MFFGPQISAQAVSVRRTKLEADNEKNKDRETPDDCSSIISFVPFLLDGATFVSDVSFPIV